MFGVSKARGILVVSPPARWRRQAAYHPALLVGTETVNVEYALLQVWDHSCNLELKDRFGTPLDNGLPASLHPF